MRRLTTKRLKRWKRLPRATEDTYTGVVVSGCQVSVIYRGSSSRYRERLLFLINKTLSVSYSNLKDVPRHGGSLDDTDNSV